MEQFLFDLRLALNENEVLKGWFVVGRGGILSIPAALVGEGLKRVASKMPWALAPERIPLIMMFVGGILGWWTANCMTMPTSIGIEIGAIAGGGSAVAYRNRGVLNGKKKGGPST
jgi:hypothetical protein